MCVCVKGGGGEDGENSVQGQFWWNGMWYGNEVGCGMSLCKYGCRLCALITSGP